MPLFSVCVCFFPLVCFLRSFIGAFFRLFSLFIYLFIYLFLFLFIFSCIDAEKTQQSCYLLSFLTRNPEVVEFKLDSSSGLCDIVFSREVTAVILVSQNNETATLLVSQTNPVGVELFSCANAFFCSYKFI